MVTSLKKKGTSLTDLNNFRGIHILPLFRQLYAYCLLPELEALAQRVIPEGQQGFVPGRRIYATYLALNSMIEAARLRGEALFVGFVDVRKAFPTVRRELLWRRLSQAGADDSLVRALRDLYEGACATVRGTGGFGQVFPLQVGTREGGVESPLLFVFYVWDLLEYLDGVTLPDDPVLLDGRAVRALQLADDLALISRSAAGLQAMMNAWAGYCDRLHQRTQLSKTEIVVFSPPGVVTPPPVCLYKGQPVRFVDQFVYLGVLEAATEGATAAWEAREADGWKAFGATCAELRLAPFLPLFRSQEVAQATVGGAYQYGAEWWGPFVPDGASRVSRQHRAWLLGFGKQVRPARLLGWIPLPDLDLQAGARALRMLEEAPRRGGLLARAVAQLQANWAAARGQRRKRGTWYGARLAMAREAWPGWLGTLPPPAFSLTDPQDLGRCFVEVATRRRWLARQQELANAPPSSTQEDYFLWYLLKQLPRPFGSALPIFLARPTVSAECFRSLLRLLAGLEDFARINAHQPRRRRQPALALARYKRCCLACLLRRRTRVLDSEWHALFACSLHRAARRRAMLQFPSEFPDRVSMASPDAHLDDLVLIILHAREHAQLLDTLCRLALTVKLQRRRFFRSLQPRVLQAAELP